MGPGTRAPPRTQEEPQGGCREAVWREAGQDTKLRERDRCICKLYISGEVSKRLAVRNGKAERCYLNE